MLNVTPTEILEQLGVPTEPKNTVERRRMLEWYEDRVLASQKDPVGELVTITPTLAQIMLERNPINRPISKNNLESINNDLVAGRFIFNGEPIIVAKTGSLLDGQHRLLNVVRTGRSIRSFIVFGPEEEARFSIDIGKVKTAAHYLSMKQYRNTNVLGSAIGYYLQWRDLGRLDHAGNKPTKTQIITAADRLKGFDESVSVTAGAFKARLGSRSIFAFCHYAFWRKTSRDSADFFMRKLIDGAGLQHGDPLFYAMHALRGAQRGVTANAKTDLLFRAWNASRRLETVQKMRIGPWQGPQKLPKLED
jgi:hypothetical protein